MNLADTIQLHAQTEAKPWYGFDFDATLAKYHHDKGVDYVGKPLRGKGTAFEKIQKYLKQGKTCKIVTARVGPDHTQEEIKQQIKDIQQWCKKYLGKTLEVVNGKDHNMVELHDDKGIEVEENTGKIK